MRFVRVLLGLLLALAGLAVTLAGAVAAFWLVGPDNTVDTGAQHLVSKGAAIATAPDLLDRHGPTLHVTATDSAKPVFVGIGQELDVSSYLEGSAYTRVVRLEVPPKLETQEMKGDAAKLNPPAGLDWWSAKATGAGEQSIAWPMADGAYSVVVMNADGTPGTDARVTLGVELEGLFVTCLLVFLAGLVLLVVGLLLIFLRRRRPSTPVPVPTVPQYEQQYANQQFQAPAYQAPQQHQGGPMRRTALAATGVSLLLVATGCAAVPEKNVSPKAATRPAVTVADGQAAVKRYTDVNNKANQARDAKLSETVEAEPTLSMSRAGFKIGRKLDAAGKEKSKPFTFTEPKIGAPRYGKYPMRFVVSSGVSGAADTRQLGVWERENAGAPWVVTYSVYPATTVKVPSVEGLRQPVKADWAKLASLPKSAADNLATYLSEGARSPKAALFTPSPGTINLLNARAKSKAADTKETYISTVVDTFRTSGDPLTFITTDGSALVFLALTEQYLQNVEPGSNAYWTSGAVTAFSSYVKYTQNLTRDHLHQAALVIPPKGKGKIRILSLDSQLVGAGGS
ncbi:hypothetical protein FB561_1388 [Kribbella amoyensis]|uniref:DUF8094 domain-containing protein n=1 Tax=Kribbella amoyensis TaxID=996641 RepID=A0A561BN99_9ACTN|nr:hypothetical protein [Kribbella amoyensis]TWD80314.1 hypothetical protein FB561_1388 [Kribbella amoyensis]